MYMYVGGGLHTPINVRPIYRKNPLLNLAQEVGSVQLVLRVMGGESDVKSSQPIPPLGVQTSQRSRNESVLG